MVEESESRRQGDRQERMGMEERADQAQAKVLPVRITRFFIEDILSPSFGHSCPASQLLPSSPLPHPRAPREDSSAEGVKEPPTPNSPQWPAWVYCTRYSDRPSSGPRMRKVRRRERKQEEKRPRTAFTSEQLERLRREFERGHYLNERRRRELALELALNESQIKIWFQNKRAKLKKARQDSGALATELKRQGLYNHSTVSKGDPTKDWPDRS